MTTVKTTTRTDEIKELRAKLAAESARHEVHFRTVLNAVAAVMPGVSVTDVSTNHLHGNRIFSFAIGPTGVKFRIDFEPQMTGKWHIRRTGKTNLVISYFTCKTFKERNDGTYNYNTVAKYISEVYAEHNWEAAQKKLADDNHAAAERLRKKIAADYNKNKFAIGVDLKSTTSEKEPITMSFSGTAEEVSAAYAALVNAGLIK